MRWNRVAKGAKIIQKSRNEEETLHKARYFIGNVKEEEEEPGAHTENAISNVSSGRNVRDLQYFHDGFRFDVDGVQYFQVGRVHAEVDRIDTTCHPGRTAFVANVICHPGRTAFVASVNVPVPPPHEVSRTRVSTGWVNGGTSMKTRSGRRGGFDND